MAANLPLQAEGVGRGAVRHRPESRTLPAVDRHRLETAFRLQTGGCRHLGSPFYGALMERALHDVERGGLVAEVVEHFRGDPLRGFLPLRLFGAVHELVLEGSAPALAAHYPTAGGDGDGDAAWPRFLEALRAHRARIREGLERFPQTNEVRRCAGLLGGFLLVSRRTGLALRLREIGCSAGLNLNWDRYHYTLGPHAWGDPSADVRLEADWEGPAPALAERPDVESRAGCDIDPRPIADDAGARKLEAYVWADQPERLARLRAAVGVGRAHPPRIDRARAEDWLAGELEGTDPGVCTVVFHSSVWLYLPEGEQARVRGLLAEAGARATRDRPLVWLRHEDTRDLSAVEIRLTLWPGGEEELLGHGHPHGRRVVWAGTGDDARA
jgi:hypothetical protein